MSCLFDSLAAFVPDSSEVIRKRVCDYLAANRPLIDGMDTGALCDEAYVAPMRQSTEWGGGPELQAACIIYCMSVVVTSRRSSDRMNKPIVFVPLTTFHTKRAFLYWTGTHFTPAPVRLIS